MFRGNVSSVSQGAGAGTLAFDSPGFTASEFVDGYRLLVEGGSLNGRMFDITANTADSVTVSDAGNEVSAAADVTAAIVPDLTLESMFPQGIGGVSESNPGDPRVLVFFNDSQNSTDGFYPEAFYYFSGAKWRKIGAPLTSDFGSVSIDLGEGAVIRNNGATTVTFYFFGELEASDVQVPVVSKALSRVENLLGLPRPLSVALSDIGLAGTSAFVTTTDLNDRKDILQVYEGGNENKKLTPTAEYFFYQGAWRKVGASAGESFDTATIPAAAAIVLSKAPSVDQTVYWTSTWDTSGLNI